MERRWTTRTRVNLPVELLQAGTHTEGCRTRDVGLGGVYLEVPSNVKLFAESHVELIFRMGEGGELTKHRVKARVVRVGDAGAGMMFRDFDASTFRSLQEILRFREDAVS
ncbi:MAG: PilZ domain-containing protein [Pseudomonadota bacterium]